MNITIEAVYESGVLRPLEPLDALKEHERVWITVQALSLVTEQRQQRIKIGQLYEECANKS
jgi:predicted DNA-binding antitoxin AbrB/MazE fold protein